MPHNVLMPALSPTMTEGKLAKWLKKEGDTVKSGQVIAEIETDKATMEVEAVDEGIVGKILVPAGTEGVKVNTLIAILLEEGEDKSVLSSTPVTPANASVQPPAPLDSGLRRNDKVDALKAISVAPVHSGARVFASPLAKRLAKEKGIDLSAVKGSGPHGRIIRDDLSAMPPTGGIPSPQPSPASGRGGGAASSIDAKALADAYGIPFKLVPNSGVRKVIARRLTEAKQTIPHFYLSVDCELDALLDVRKQVNEAADGFKLSVNDFIIKATAVALQKYPAANVSWTEDSIVQYERADVSVAVATPSGLITPIIKDAANKSLKEISNEMKELAAKAKDGKLKPQEFQGGTISVSNLGMFGIREFAAIVNPPQGAILAVGAGEQRAVVKNGALTVANMMTVTMSTDHRCIDGAIGAEYLKVFKKLIENPMGLLL